MNPVPPFVGLCVLLLVGHVLRTKIRLLQKLYLPSCVIAGLVGLIVIQAGRSLGRPVPEVWTLGWGRLPGFLINIVFACLFLGVTLPRVSEVWRRAGPQVIYGQIVAWGQYVVGIGLVLVVLAPMIGLAEPARSMFGGILPVGFEGGHGTAAGMGPVFVERGWPEGKDLALASATCGILGAIIVGMVLVNWATRKGYTTRRLSPADVPEDDTIGIIPVGQRPSAGKLSVKSDAIESFTLNLAFVAVAVLIGWVLKQGILGVQSGAAWVADWEWPAAFEQAPLVWLAGAVDAVATFLGKRGLLTSFPLFPLCMLGGLAVQCWEQHLDRHKLIDLGLIRRIQNTALDFLVVAAIATIRLDVVAKGLAPLLILVAAGIAWNVFCVMVLARRLLPDAWFERSIAEMGQSMGVTATGLLLLRVVDPDYETPAADAFAYKQLIHEPFMGGGLWTSTAIPLLAIWGGWPVFAIAAGAVLFWLLIAVLPRLARAR